ncbi:uncharacterized protein LOC110454998 [Mizuhopecten yessoensis]|uniref:Kinesin-like protein KIF24 n=1 Tax=Mizuhopecten yessoensis TaxID=6573 RepID=A0A210QE05_MIZYE|nr:uncharacterized protein LOC110454998 [Mizuhopecten yessoensis]OWF46911.1 Kinesin-like protein KIF24 [Mizuhopecten yessoensis]
MGTLFECLREARLEKYYPTLRVNGITKSESLAKLTLEDCEAIGVTSTEDKRRLIELINIIKSVHQSESPNVTPPRTNAGARPSSARKRNRSPAYTAQSQMSGYALSATNNVRVRENQPTAQAHSGNQFLSRAEIFDLVSSSDESSSEGSAHSDYEPAKKHLNAASVSPPPPRIRKSAVSRVRQSGYNYGVPKAGSIAQSVSKTKARGAEGGLLGDERIRVCVRKRPMNKREIKNKEEDICKAESTTTLTVNEPKQAVDLTAYTLEHEFIFDEVFDEKCSNEDVYVRAARPLVSNIFTGGSATCFAYGQTGAGKTHTMIGTRDVPGLYLLASHDIFSIIESKQYGSDLKVWVSFFEIYCGQLFDLLNKRNRLHAREDGSHHVCITGLTETQVQNVAAIMQVLEYGNSVRSKGVTGVNPDSSRSHAVLQIEIRNSQDKRVGRMSFIDLAGSERASDMTETDRQTRMEGAEINQSLLALKECIRSIDQDSKHTPFRQSKLTHILKDSFVGNSRTCMIANFSPTNISGEHTLNTLRYADRVKELRRDPGAGGTRASLATNILMNIPLQAPSVFQPSNVLCSSTPMRHRSSRQSSSRVVSDIALDPNETPIKGHGMRRKVVPKNIAKSESSKPSRSVASRLSVVRHTGPSKSSSPVTSRRNLRAEAACQDSSTDDTPEHTESDSNNITVPNRQRVGIGASNVPITHSQDTDNDFPTTDFNNEEMLNDLNKTGGKRTETGQTMPMGETSTATASQAVTGGVHLSTAGHPLPMIEQGKASHGASSCTNNHAIPILRNKKYTESPRVTIASVSSTGADQPSPSSRNIQGSGSSGAVAKGPKVSDTLPQRHSRPSSEFNDSFEDDLLFEGTNRVPDSARGYPRKPSTGESNLQNSGGDNNSPNLGLSRGRDAPFKVPQDNLTTPAIPAVLTAISSDLTTFSQRSPGRIGNNRFHKPEPPQGLPSNNRPPFTKEKTSENPMASRPRILRTPPPVVSESLMESPEYQGRSKVSAPFSVSHQPYRNFNDNGANTNRLSPHNVARQTNVRENNRDNIDQEVELPSTGEWYATPAHFDTHMSVQKSSNFVSQSSSKLQPGAFFSKYKEFTSNITPEKPYEDYFDEEETEIKGVDGDMSEFLTVQRRQTTPENRKVDTASRQNVASRLRSVFFKPPSENSELHGPSTSKPSESKSVTSDSGLAVSVSDSPQAVRTCWDSSTNPVLNVPSPQSITIPTLLQGSSHNLLEIDKIPALFDPSNKENILATKYHQDGTVSFSSSSSHDSRSENSVASGGRSANNSSAIKTEKLTVGSAFSPIHPQPVTSSNRLTKSVAVGIVSKDILQPKALTMSTDNAGNGRRRTISDESIPTDPRQRLISAHEDQLAVVTSLCKLEMKLLLGAKAGTKTYDEYVDKVSNILSQKMAAMQLLQEHIKSYTAFQVHRGADSS